MEVVVEHVVDPHLSLKLAVVETAQEAWWYKYGYSLGRAAALSFFCLLKRSNKARRSVRGGLGSR